MEEIYISPDLVSADETTLINIVIGCSDKDFHPARTDFVRTRLGIPKFYHYAVFGGPGHLHREDRYAEWIVFLGTIHRKRGIANLLFFTHKPCAWYAVEFSIHTENERVALQHDHMAEVVQRTLTTLAGVETRPNPHIRQFHEELRPDRRMKIIELKQ